jgi:hypothetical protein
MLRERDFNLHLQMADALGTVHMRIGRLLRGRLRPERPKLVSYQMAASVPEIMHVSGTRFDSAFTTFIPS